MENAIVIAILVVLVGGAIWYIVRAKKNGAKCIGCSAGGSCHSGSEGCSCGCGGDNISEADNGKDDKMESSCCCCHTDADK